MSVTFSLNIVLLHADSDGWCEFCSLPCATTITYVVETDGRVPDEVGRLTYCEGCDIPD